LVGSPLATHLPNEIFQLLLHQFTPGEHIAEKKLADGHGDVKIKGCDFGYALAANSCEGWLNNIWPGQSKLGDVGVTRYWLTLLANKGLISASGIGPV